MSDPVTNVEIEDVLSSIRRLVSESGGTPAEPKKPAAAPVVSRAEPEPEAGPATLDPDTLDKLVLTPSLRVADAPEAAEADQESAAQAEPEAKEPIAETNDAPGDEAAAGPAPEATEETSPEPEPEAEAQAEAQADSDSLKDRIQQLETAVSAQEGEWEEEDVSEALVWEDHSTEEATPAGPLGAEEYSEAQMAEAQSAPQEDDAAFDFMNADEALLDEDTLREMVSEIVRQELQGALGERITRNVRKLVRREIHRALMAQEFE